MNIIDEKGVNWVRDNLLVAAVMSEAMAWWDAEGDEDLPQLSEDDFEHVAREIVECRQSVWDLIHREAQEIIARRRDEINENLEELGYA